MDKLTKKELILLKNYAVSIRNWELAAKLRKMEKNFMTEDMKRIHEIIMSAPTGTDIDLKYIKTAIKKRK